MASLQQTPTSRPMPVCSFALYIPALSFTVLIWEFWYQKKNNSFVFHFCFQHFTFVHNSPSFYGRGGASLLSLAVGAQPPSILPTPKGSATNGKTENNCCVAVICDLCWQRPLFECRSTYLTTRFRAQQPTIVLQNSSTYLVSLMSYLGNINVQSKK